MTVTEYPKDDYQSFTCENYLLAEIILDAHNGDYTCYEGTLIDNFIMHQPQPFDITKVKDLANEEWDDEIKQFFAEQNYEYLVILARYVNQWSSVNELVYTNDHKWVEAIENMLTETNVEELAVV